MNKQQSIDADLLWMWIVTCLPVYPLRENNAKFKFSENWLINNFQHRGVV